MIKIEDLEQGDVLTWDSGSSCIILSTYDNKITIHDSNNGLVYADIEFFRNVTSHMRNGVELLKKELVPAPRLDWSPRTRDKSTGIDRIQSNLMGLKETLGDKSEFIYAEGNSIILYDSHVCAWVHTINACFNVGLPTFTDSTDSERQQVLDYLNKTFPNGWAV